MDTEIEVKFLNMDFDQIRAKLQYLGATCEQPMRLMKRAIIDYPDLRMKTNDEAFIRVRDEGHAITMTYKQFTAQSVDGAKEIEVTVGDFDKTTQLLEAAGLKIHSLQESKRETWRLDDVEIMLDEWPWLQPYIEIESHSEQRLRDVATQLEIDWNDAVFGDVMMAYRAEYPYLKKGDGHNVGRVERVAFGDPFPELLKETSYARD